MRTYFLNSQVMVRREGWCFCFQPCLSPLCCWCSIWVLDINHITEFILPAHKLRLQHINYSWIHLKNVNSTKNPHSQIVPVIEQIPQTSDFQTHISAGLSVLLQISPCKPPAQPPSHILHHLLLPHLLCFHYILQDVKKSQSVHHHGAVAPDICSN